MAESEDVRVVLMAEASASVSPLSIRVRPLADGYVAELVSADGSILWPDYARGSDELLAALAAEQRFLVEERGAGSVAGSSYLDKAHERLRRAAAPS